MWTWRYCVRVLVWLVRITLVPAAVAALKDHPGVHRFELLNCSTPADTDACDRLEPNGFPSVQALVWPVCVEHPRHTHCQN